MSSRRVLSAAIPLQSRASPLGHTQEFNKPLHTQNVERERCGTHALLPQAQRPQHAKVCPRRAKQAAAVPAEKNKQTIKKKVREYINS